MQYRRYIINDPIIYLAADRKSFRVGTAEQAKEGGWVSMAAERAAHASE